MWKEPQEKESHSARPIPREYIIKTTASPAEQKTPPPQPPTNKAGGVAIAVIEEIASKTTKVENIEDHEQEIVWIEYKPTNNNKIYIGAYYGKQEKEPLEIIEREYSQLQTQKKQDP